MLLLPTNKFAIFHSAAATDVRHAETRSKQCQTGEDSAALQYDNAVGGGVVSTGAADIVDVADENEDEAEFESANADVAGTSGIPRVSRKLPPSSRFSALSE